MLTLKRNTKRHLMPDYKAAQERSFPNNLLLLIYVFVSCDQKGVYKVIQRQSELFPGTHTLYIQTVVILVKNNYV